MSNLPPYTQKLVEILDNLKFGPYVHIQGYGNAGYPPDLIIDGTIITKELEKALKEWIEGNGEN